MHNFDNKHYSILDHLDYWAIHQPGVKRYEFFDGKGRSVDSLTSTELQAKVNQVASYLVERVKPGDRVIIVMQPGLDYVIAFLATLAARAIAVPCYPPFATNLAQQFNAIVENCEPSAIFTDHSILTILNRLKLASNFQRFPIIKYLVNKVAEKFDSAIEKHFSNLAILLMEEAKSYPKILSFSRPDGEEIAFIQYTSGSTGKPKGVVLKHKNLVMNASLCKDTLVPRSDGIIIGLSWLPPYHDMGLIGSIIQPLYQGHKAVLFSPASFLKDPILWLRLMMLCKAEVSGAPNFAYDLCIKRATEEDLDKLNLSTWQVAFNGADFIHPDTIDNFAEKFGRCGFKKNSFYPCYGLAEATLFISGKGTNSESHSPIKVKTVNSEGIKRVSCGKPHKDIKVVIVNPQTHEKCKNEEIGEIWVQGPHLASGYYKNEENTREVFNALIKNHEDEGPYLRTGDLGCIHEGELYITGRIKDIIILRGRNYYPQDLEVCYQEINTNIRKGCGAVFQINDGELAVVQEVKDNSQLDDLGQSIRQKILEEFGLTISEILFLTPQSIPKTTSGKLKRLKIQSLYKENALPCIKKIIF